MCFCPISILRKRQRQGFEDLDYQNKTKNKLRKGALCVCPKSIREILCQEAAFLYGRFPTIAIYLSEVLK